MGTGVPRERLQALCEAIVPGSEATGSAAYFERAVAALPEPAQVMLAGALDQLGDGSDLAAHVATPEFGFVRALAIEAYYSDFVDAGRPGPGAWDAIDFNSPLARRLDKDFDYLEER